MADLKPIPFGSKPLAPIPFGSKPIAPPVAAPAAPGEGNIFQKLAGTVNETAANIGGRINAGAKALNDSASGKIEAPEAGLRIFGQVVGVGNDLVSGAVKGGLQTADAATFGLGGKAVNAGIGALAQTPLGAMGISAIKGGADKWAAFQEKYPRAAQDLQAVPEVGQMLLNFVGAGVASKTVVPVVKTAVTATAKAAAERSAAKALETTVAAVTPELKGTKLAQGYKDVVTGSRDVTKGKAFSRQALTASEREAQVGKNLHEAGITLKNNPVKDLQTLRGGLQKTEAQLENVLNGDPEMVFLADKPTLFKTLNDISKNVPEQFKAIKDEGAVFNSVINYGKKILNKTSDDVRGLRNARSAFDAQAKIEFPSAYKGGSIDTKTPAGRAIKAVRDAINDHLYDTAPQGSEIKRLIGLEADIFRATDAIAARAASSHGKSALKRIGEVYRDHPVLAPLGTAASAIGVSKTLGL